MGLHRYSRVVLPLEQVSKVVSIFSRQAPLWPRHSLLTYSGVSPPGRLGGRSAFLLPVNALVFVRNFSKRLPKDSQVRSFRQQEAGLSMLEVLVSMALLILAVVSFATVYPGGFKLHRKSRVSHQAAQVARSILSELKNLPLTREDGGLSLASLAANGYQDSTQAHFPRTPLPDEFSLKKENGIRVILYDLASGTDPSVYASIEVTIVYHEHYRESQRPIEMTLSAGKTCNR